MQNLFSLIRLHLFIFISIILEMVKEDLAVIYVKSVLPVFSSKRFIVSGLIFRSLIHFEFIFMYGVRECSNLIFYRFSFSIPLIRETVFSLLYIFVSFVEDK